MKFTIISVSKERDRDNTATGGLIGSITNTAAATATTVGSSGITEGSSGTGIRFRNQSPSTRRSRERNRKESGKSQQHLQQQQLQQSIVTPILNEQIGNLTYNEMSNTAADTSMGSFEDSRLSGMTNRKIKHEIPEYILYYLLPFFFLLQFI